jgi:hypothetical protein
MGTLGRQPLLQRASSSNAVPHTARILRNVIAFVGFKLCGAEPLHGGLYNGRKNIFSIFAGCTPYSE